MNIKDKIHAQSLAQKGMNPAEIKDFFKQDVLGWKKYLYRFLTFNYVCIGWLFFRSESFDDSMVYISSLFTNTADISTQLPALGILLGLIVMIFAIYPLLTKVPNLFVDGIKRIPWLLLPVLFVGILWVVITLAPSGIPQFIYASF